MNINLNRRERIVLLGAGVFIGLFIIFQLIIAPVFQKQVDLKRKLASRQQMVEEMQTLRSEYLSIKQKTEISKDEYAGRSPGFTLFSLLDKQAGASGVKEHITYMKPSSAVDSVTGLNMSYVELKLQEITMEDLSSFLFRVELSENMVKVRNLSVTKSGEGNGLISAVMQVETVSTKAVPVK